MIRVEHFHNLTKQDIKQRIRKCKVTREHERLVCIKSSMEGLDVPMIATILCRDEQTIREWIHTFNTEGEIGLLRESPPGLKKN